MVADHYIAARVPSEIKTRLKLLAQQRDISESALLKQLLEHTLGGFAVPQLGNPEPVNKVTRAGASGAQSVGC